MALGFGPLTLGFCGSHLSEVRMITGAGPGGRLENKHTDSCRSVWALVFDRVFFAVAPLVFDHARPQTLAFGRTCLLARFLSAHA